MASTPALPHEGTFPSLASTTAWLNSPPLRAQDLHGKVVLVDFWTYTCINWQRSFPYVRAWYEKYKAHGLVVIGAHTPEFPFEADIENVRRAVKELGVDYPVAVDSEYAIWQAFDNQYWPALYVIDAKGQIRYHQFGEGEYDRSEGVIRQLLTEAGNRELPQGTARSRGAVRSLPPIGTIWNRPKPTSGTSAPPIFLARRTACRTRGTSIPGLRGLH